ncbi:relaxin receptor 1-like [Styela clava]
MKQGKTATNTDTQKERGKKMRRKITRIIVKDFLSWMSICFMAFMQVAGVDIPNDTYVVVGLILIPINSALNPLLFSEAPEYIWQRVKPFFARITKLRNFIYPAERRGSVGWNREQQKYDKPNQQSTPKE